MQSFAAAFLAFVSVLGSLPARSSSEPVKLQLERFEQVGGEGIADCSKLRVRKYNRTVFALDGTLHMLKDLDSSYEVTVRVAYSTMGNNQFNEYPMKLPQKSICRLLVEEYVDYQFIWGESTTLPKVAKGTKEFCPFPKGEYLFRDMVPDASFIPPVVPAGLWRMSIVVLNPGDVVVLQLRIFYRVVKGKGM
ncbi:conserved hypothetical protein [Culex quinquefasciatus]|uniref:MD-2-related lipid-recognition domain-containing protein n=1 Tax=Culex quinquefasciatus TaxID=7176 RepID=B0XEE7_CULQU|nr:conserved hypothetical protein [Culex quinquefasciatus]|eukprot:XP_001868019.1 conserved hypothetical protein [Culex quinquefasciatus]